MQHKFWKVFIRAWPFMTSWREEFLVWAFLPDNVIGSAAQEWLEKNVSKKECVFGCEGKLILFSFPKNPALREQWMRFVFPGQQRSFATVYLFPSFRWWMFYKQGPVRCWICTSFDTERWSGPSNKRSRSWFGTGGCKWNCITFLCFVGKQCLSVHDSLALSTAHAQLFWERIVKLYLSFKNLIKLKTLWRYEGCKATL